MCNPRNAYQRYNAATNSTDRVLNTYMGTLLPGPGMSSYSGAGVLNPISNDPNFRLIGSGVPIFLCGAPGIVVGEGTQHSPAGGFGTLMVTGDMKQMSQDYLRAATMTGYGVTMYVGLGIPLPGARPGCRAGNRGPGRGYQRRYHGLWRAEQEPPLPAQGHLCGTAQRDRLN